MYLQKFLGELQLELNSITEELKILELVETYQLHQEIDDQLSDSIKTNLTIKNVLKILGIAHSRKCKALKEACHKFLDTHAEEIVEKPEFLNLPQV